MSLESFPKSAPSQVLPAGCVQRCGGKRPRLDRVSSLAESDYVCQCFGINAEQLECIAHNSQCYEFQALREYYDIGSRCTSCEIEVRDLLTEWRRNRDTHSRSPRVSLMKRSRRWLRQMKKEGRYWVRRLLRVPRNFGLFVARSEEHESELVLSNLTFPEDARNANGGRVRFDTIVYDADGTLLGRRRGLTLAANCTGTYSLNLLAPQAPQNFHGTLMVQFYGLRETGALRPYCRFRWDRRDDGRYHGGAHYHDQFHKRPEHQHVLVTHPTQPRYTCRVALSNPCDVPYVSKAYLQSEGQRLEADVHIAPHGALWASMDELFGPAAANAAANSYFWLESEATIMAWYFWKKDDQNLWILQHK